MKNKKGISIIVLIITIIVVIILAAVVILTLSKNNPIESAKEARYKEDVRTFQDELAMTVSKQYADAGGHRDEKITTSDFNEIKKYIPSFSEKYKNKFVIKNDELVPIDEDELNALKFLDEHLSKDIRYLIENGVEIDLSDIDIEANKKISNAQSLTDFKRYISSSVYSAEWNEEKAFDNNKGSYWCTSDRKQNDSYIGVEFEEETNISFVSFYSKPEYKCKEIKLQCSNDNNTWVDATDIILLDNIDKENIIVNTKQNTAFKYWRIYVISTYTGYATASEINFYSSNQQNFPKIENVSDHVVNYLLTADVKLEINDVITHNFYDKINSSSEKIRSYVTSTNFIEGFKNKKIGMLPSIKNNDNVISSSIYNGEYNAYMAFDNNTGSYWCTASGKQNNSYIGYIFDKETYIHYVDVYSSAYRPKQVKLQCSNDNNIWIDASDVVTLEDNSDTHTIESNIKDRAYKYWRLYVITAYTGYTGIYELDFYGI